MVKNKMADCTIWKPDTNCVRKMTIWILDCPVFRWWLYSLFNHFGCVMPKYLNLILGVVASIIQDAGHTQIAPGSRTVVRKLERNTCRLFSSWASENWTSQKFRTWETVNVKRSGFWVMRNNLAFKINIDLNHIWWNFFLFKYKMV